MNSDQKGQRVVRGLFWTILAFSVGQLIWTLTDLRQSERFTDLVIYKSMITGLAGVGLWTTYRKGA